MNEYIIIKNGIVSNRVIGQDIDKIRKIYNINDIYIDNEKLYNIGDTYN